MIKRRHIKHSDIIKTTLIPGADNYIWLTEFEENKRAASILPQSETIRAFFLLTRSDIKTRAEETEGCFIHPRP